VVGEWLGTTWQEVILVVLSALLIFGAVILVVRLNGLRSFSKMSSFDFAVTVAIGSLIAGVSIGSSSAVNGIVALVVIIGSQRVIARLRRKTQLERVIDNTPTLLMIDGRMIEENLEKTRITHADVRAKLREANVLEVAKVRAVVLETTGDISVLHGDTVLDPGLLEGVVGSDLIDNR
jgi:uncharacterized membrane protein YcaP (DUF421 family)